jgi:hypothetical protein
VDLAHFCGQYQFLLAIPVTNTSHYKSCTISTIQVEKQNTMILTTDDILRHLHHGLYLGIIVSNHALYLGIIVSNRRLIIGMFFVFFYLKYVVYVGIARSSHCGLPSTILLCVQPTCIPQVATAKSFHPEESVERCDYKIVSSRIRRRNGQASSDRR